MYTCCPYCSAVFRVSATLLGKAAGAAHCGQCQRTFPAVEYLFEDLDAVRATLGQAGTSEPAGTDDAAPEQQDHLFIAMEEMDGSINSGEAGAVDEELQQASLLSAWQQQGAGAREAFSVFMILLLVGVLGLQWVFFSRDQLVEDPSWRATLEPVCKLLGCSLPFQAEFDKLALTARDVRRHPAVRSALLVNVTFENRAGFTQPYPYLEVVFSNQTGDPVAMRRFSPEEYLGTRVLTARGIPAQGIVSAALELVDPGEEAISFQFDFL